MTGVPDTVGEMARREAAAHALVATSVVRPVIHAITCSWCGTEEPAAPVTPAGSPVVTTLACEWLAPRTLLAAATLAAHLGTDVELRFRTRAVCWAQTDAASLDDDGLAELISVLNTSETWVAASQSTSESMVRPLTLPASTRSVCPSNWDDLAPNFLTPHPTGGLLSRLNEHYQSTRRDAIAGLLSQGARRA